MKKIVWKFLCLLLGLAVLYACGSSPSQQTANVPATEATSHPKGQASVEDDVSERNILQVAIGSPAHSTLVKAVEAAQIEHILVNAGPLTVFAPTNDAFGALPSEVLNDLLQPGNKGKLATVLTRHAAPGSYDIEALKKEAKKGRKLYMATGDYLEVVVDGDEVVVNGARVISTIQTSNGIINVVDKVILPN